MFYDKEPFLSIKNFNNKREQVKKHISYSTKKESMRFVIHRIIFIGLLGILLFTVDALNAQTTTLVSIGSNGKLVYTPDAKGNKVPDFSGVGYMNSEAPIPTVPVVLTISPVTGDNYTNVQNAINTVAAMPLDANGFRGAILFTAGTYNISNTINITASGIVLRGVGFNGSGTNFYATKTAQHTLFSFAGTSGTSTVSSTKKAITDSYVPYGTTQITVASGHTFVAGDKVFVHRIPNAAWINLLGMDSLTLLDPIVTNWTASAYDMYSDRIVKAVNGNVITLDAPIMDIIDPQYATGELMKYTTARIEKCGIENMRISSYYASATDENHGWDAITFDKIINSWARNIEVYYFGYSAVNVMDNASWITVDSCKMLDAKSTVDGGRRYSFNINGQRSLIKNCTTRDGRHDYVNGSRTCGPNVFYNCTSSLQNNDIGPHHRWSTGILFDNIKGNGKQNVQNRTTSGSGHGWSGAQIMFWNCTASRMVIQNPRGDVRNWAIGAICPDITKNGDMTNNENLGIIQSQGINITAIPSLFIKQLSDRLSNAVPVQLINFEATKKEKSVYLSWTTASENNNSHFVVEQSLNGIDFNKVGQVNGNGTTNQTSQYSFEHLTPSNGNNYYRLKQLDVDGKITYSNIKIIDFDVKRFTIKSNIVQHEIEITTNENMDLFFYNTQGQKVKAIKINGQQKINVSQLSTGMYFIQSSNGKQTQFIKQ